MTRIFVAIGNWILDSITRVLSVIGLVGIAVWLSGMLFGTAVILFATGSMAPTIPQGAAVFSMSTPAKDLQVGEVVTVPRGVGELPVSHRIVEVRPVDGQPEQRALVLKGDANPTEDASPYIVSSAPRVLFVVPGGADVLKVLSDPRIMVAIGIILLGLMVRAFGGTRIVRALRSEDRSTPEVRATPVVSGVPDVEPEQREHRDTFPTRRELRASEARLHATPSERRAALTTQR